MQVILLAAGQSTRLDPISDKNTLEFSGKALIEHQVMTLKKARMRDIVVVANQYNQEKIRRILKSYKNVAVTEQKDLEAGQAGGVLAGAKLIKHKKVLIMSTNDVFDESLFEAIIITSKTKGVDGVVAGKKMNEYFPGGYLEFGKNEFITDIIEKPGAGKEPSKFVNLICHIYNDFPTFINHLKTTKTKKDDRYEVALDNYIKKGKAKILIHKYEGYWQAVKYPWHILSLMNHFLGSQKPHIAKSAQIAKSAIIEGNVLIQNKVKVLHNAVIQGPALIGEGTVIANNALVRESMVGKNCVVGFATEVARSYLNHDVWMHSNYIGDSIIDHNVSFGAGTVLGNLRFDEANVKVSINKDRMDSGMNKLGAIIGSGVRMGINSSSNPGVKIGRDSFVGGAVLVERDIPPGKIILTDQKLTQRNNFSPIKIENRQTMKKKLK